MKIGIITVHRAYNYGSVLQCYALQEYLKSLGHDVWVIDYRQQWTEAVYKPFSLYYIWHFLKQKDIRAIIDYWRKRKSRAKRLNETKPLFESFMKRMRLTSPCRRRVPSGFDIYLIEAISCGRINVSAERINSIWVILIIPFRARLLVIH